MVVEVLGRWCFILGTCFLLQPYPLLWVLVEYSLLPTVQGIVVLQAALEAGFWPRVEEVEGMVEVLLMSPRWMA